MHAEAALDREYGWFCPHCPFKSRERDEVVVHAARVGHGQAIWLLWIPTIRLWDRET